MIRDARFAPTVVLLILAASGGPLGCSRNSSDKSPRRPPAPAGLQVCGTGCGEVEICWDTIPNAEGYYVYRSNQPGCAANGTSLQPPNSPLVPSVGPIQRFIDATASSGTTYFYCVRAASKAGTGPYSSEVSAMPLDAPASFTATAIGAEVELDWILEPGAVSYNVYWSSSQGVTRATGNQIPSVLPGVRHAPTQAGVKYYYVVTATNDVGSGAESCESSEGCAVPLAQPGGILAIPKDEAVEISWVMRPSLFYDLYWSDLPGVSSATGSRIPSVTSPFLHAPLQNGLEYHYVLVATQAECGGSMSVDSAPASATPTASGTLDSAFGGRGWIVHAGAAGGGGDDLGLALAIDGAGRIVVAGCSDADTSPSVTDFDLAVWRYFDDGTLDLSFNSPQGFFVHSNPGADDRGRDLGIDGQNRIVIAGESEGPAGDLDMAVWRLLEDGSDLDTSFDLDGLVIRSGDGGGFGDEAGYGLAIDPSTEDILIAGVAEGLSDPDLAIWRLAPDGSPAPGFGVAMPGYVGVHDTAGGAGLDRGNDVALDSSGFIVVVGASLGPGGNLEMAIWRLDPAGNLDPTFNGGGWLIHGNAAGGDRDDEGNAVAIDGQGRILTAGTSFSLTPNSSDALAVWQVEPGPPTSLTWTETHQGAAGAFLQDVGADVVIDTLDRAVFAGWSTRQIPGPDLDLAIWRYESTGLLDPGFFPTNRGFVTHHDAAGGNRLDRGRAAALDSAGCIVVAGESVNPAGDLDMVLWRFRP